MNPSPDFPQVGIARMHAHGLIEVGNCLREAVQIIQCMRAMVVGVGIARITFQSSGVALDQRFGDLGVVLKVPCKRAIVDLKRGQGRRLRIGRCIFGRGGRVPVETQPGEVLADTEMTPTRKNFAPVLPFGRMSRIIGQGDKSPVSALGTRWACERIMRLEPRPAKFARGGRGE
jgi:hypothetical protein